MCELLKKKRLLTHMLHTHTYTHTLTHGMGSVTDQRTSNQPLTMATTPTTLLTFYLLPAAHFVAVAVHCCNNSPFFGQTALSFARWCVMSVCASLLCFWGGVL